MDENIQNYELAFHLNPNLEEAKAAEIKQNIEEIVTQNGGIISFSGNPAKIRLSYLINHKGNSYFGYTQFGLSSKESLIHINEQLKLNSEIMRYLVIKMPSESEKKQAALKQMKFREKAGKRASAKTSAKTATPAPANKELDKQLEEIIGNL